jgi:hypothetical protein
VIQNNISFLRIVAGTMVSAPANMFVVCTQFWKVNEQLRNTICQLLIKFYINSKFHAISDIYDFCNYVDRKLLFEKSSLTFIIKTSKQYTKEWITLSMIISILISKFVSVIFVYVITNGFISDWSFSRNTSLYQL